MYKKNLKKDAIDMLMIYYLSCFIHDVVFSFTMILCESLGHMMRFLFFFFWMLEKKG